MGALSAVNPHGVGARYAELGNGELGLRLSNGDAITGVRRLLSRSIACTYNPESKPPSAFTQG